jgi:hypothetical protein
MKANKLTMMSPDLTEALHSVCFDHIGIKMQEKTPTKKTEKADNSKNTN